MKKLLFLAVAMLMAVNFSAMAQTDERFNEEQITEYENLSIVIVQTVYELTPSQIQAAMACLYAANVTIEDYDIQYDEMTVGDVTYHYTYYLEVGAGQRGTAKEVLNRYAQDNGITAIVH